MTLDERNTKALQKKARRGFQGYPVATVAYYGPNTRKATKAAVAVVPDESAEPVALERWFNDTRDIRRDDRTNQQILQFIRTHGAKSVAMTGRIIGCPHEEGVDYPEGEACPECPYWAGGDRWSGVEQGESGPRDDGGADPSAGGSAARQVNEEVAQRLQEHEFADMGEIQAFVEDFMAERNRTGIDDFDGLSPQQMQALLYHPFESPPLDGLEQRLPADLEAPAVGLFGLIAEAARERGIKLTARGNLPLKLVKAADAWLREHGRRGGDRMGSITTERDVSAFHYVRVVAEAAGLLRKARGYLYLTRRAERLVDAEDRAGLYTRLFTAYTRRFNWAYRDALDDLPIVRDSFGFTLYLLHRHGGNWRPADLYEDAFLRAFPMALDEAKATREAIGLDPERRVRLAWRSRTLSGFAHLFDLAELASETGTPPSLIDDMLYVRATPLLAHVFPQPPPR